MDPGSTRSAIKTGKRYDIGPGFCDTDSNRTDVWNDWYFDGNFCLVICRF
ncbi:Uncharacterised protein [Chlamydia trachomatis]|nr:Uncharacterised protein [Chlamydia trachomatis]